MTTAVPEVVKIFLLNHGQVKFLTPIFVPLPNKGDVTKCTINCIIALFPHANKILLRFIQIQLETYIVYETPMEQAGLRKGRGAREQIVKRSRVDHYWKIRARKQRINIGKTPL